VIAGKAGEGLAMLSCKELINVESIHSLANELMSSVWLDGEWFSKKKRVNCDFGSGLAGMLYFLLEYGRQFKQVSAVESACKGLTMMLQKSIQQDSRITWTGKFGRSVDHWWCEGVAGMALTFLKAFELTGEGAYRKIAESCLSDHPVELIWRNLSLCHGLAGLGEVYLEAGVVLNDEKWNARAGELVTVLHAMRRRKKEVPAYWLIENESKPVANLMIGNSGILHFLLRYYKQGIFGFPGLS
jgi:lantibiotic modifying enzyme